MNGANNLDYYDISLVVSHLLNAESSLLMQCLRLDHCQGISMQSFSV